jgi:E3 ubiquitin-protein ligase TRIP12
MYRGLPSGNKILTKKWQEKERRIHMQKLRNVKPTIDLKKPKKFTHLKSRAKKEQMLEDRYTEIERENRILLEKMTSIMQKPNRTTTSFSTDRYAQVANNKKSLNRAARKQELLKITLENQAILRRLQDKQSNYNVSKWENDHRHRQELLKNMSEYPYEMQNMGKKRRFNMSEAGGTAYRPRSLGPRQTWRSKNNTAKTAPIVKQAEALDENRIVHYKKGKQLGNGYYIVEISSNSNNLFIAAYDVESTESFLITLQEKRASELMVEFENNYELMASSLQVMNKRLYLLNPKYLADQKAQQEQVPEDQQELGDTVPQEEMEGEGESQDQQPHIEEEQEQKLDDEQHNDDQSDNKEDEKADSNE